METICLQDHGRRGDEHFKEREGQHNSYQPSVEQPIKQNLDCIPATYYPVKQNLDTISLPWKPIAHPSEVD
jgi:hypothetical protein